MSEAKGTVVIYTEYVDLFTLNMYTYIFSNGNSYFTGSDNVPITLPTREGYTRTWAATKTFERPPLSDGTAYYNDITGTTYNVYISRADVYGIKVYVNTDWVFRPSDTIKQYTLAYTGGGTLSGGTPAGNHNYGATINLPTTKEKTGHTFNNFTKDGVEISGTSFSLPASNTTVTANWTIRQYTLTYNDNNGTLSDGTPAGDYNYGATIDLPTTKEKTGHTFSHFTNNNGDTISGDSFSLPASDTRVIAYWTIRRFSLTYTGGGTLRGGTDAGYHNYGATIRLHTTNTKTGYTFKNFTKDEVIISGTSFSLPASNTTVTANWKINRYTVTYLSIPDHFDFTSTPTLYDYNTLLRHTTIDIPTPRVIGEVYSFEKWTYGGSDLGENRLPPENINLEANWNSTDKDEIQMSELSSVFDPSSSFQNIKISNYFDRLKLNDSSQRENVDFFNKLKGRGTF